MVVTKEALLKLEYNVAYLNKNKIRNRSVSNIIKNVKLKRPLMKPEGTLFFPSLRFFMGRVCVLSSYEKLKFETF